MRKIKAGDKVVKSTGKVPIGEGAPIVWVPKPGSAPSASGGLASQATRLRQQTRW